MDDLSTAEFMKQQVAAGITVAVRAAGGSQTKAAEKAQVQRPLINKIVKGRISDVSLQLLLDVAEGLGVECKMQVSVEGIRVHPKILKDPILTHLPDDYW